MGAVIAALLVGAATAGLIGFGAGAHAAGKAELRKAIREAGLNQDSVKLYFRAAKILRRLEGLTDLDGDLSPDILTATTRKQVTDWLADYRKGLNNL